MLKEFIPPILLRYLIGFFYGWKGDYRTWAEAKSKCSGYDSEIIFSKVKDSLLKVKNGEVAFERDSIIFDKIHYSFPLLSALAIVALRNNGELNVLDFGGSLGSSYYQNKDILNGLQKINWNIVEQSHFVKEGQNSFSDNNLFFFYNLQSCLENNKVDVVLFASVIQYLEDPYSILEEIISSKIEYLILDRTPVFTKKEERITIQKVPKSIYDAQYPCWIFSENKLKNFLFKYYDPIFDQELPERVNLNGMVLKSYFFKRK